MLAYSAIAHAGYMLVGMAAVVAAGGRRDVFTTCSDTSFTNLGAFAVVIALERRGDIE